MFTTTIYVVLGYKSEESQLYVESICMSTCLESVKSFIGILGYISLKISQAQRRKGLALHS